VGRRARVDRTGADVLLAAAVAGTLSGAPSTLHALLTGRSALDAVRAAGEVFGRRGVVRGAAAHAVLSGAWATVLVIVLPRRRAPAWGATAGLAIAGLDLAVAARRVPAVAARPPVPQIADHVAFGTLVGAVLRHRTSRRAGAATAVP
jgi:hypothetical protein